MMKDDILATSALFKGKCTLTSVDYKQILIMATEDDLIYMDPPYQGTFVNGGFRYYGDIELADFIDSLQDLNGRRIPFILSYDGRTGNKTFGESLPSHLELTRIEVEARRSSQATLLGRNHTTFESVYLRVPYEISGNGISIQKNLDDFMLLCGSCNRAKSWSCEHCINWKEEKDANICKQCYWGKRTSPHLTVNSTSRPATLPQRSAARTVNL